MSNKTTPTLKALIKNIDDVSTIRDILVTYDAQLEAANQYEVNVIFPILVAEMQVVDSVYKKAMASQIKFQQSIEDFTVLVKEATFKMGGLNSIMTAVDAGSALTEYSKKLNDQYQVFFSSSQTLRNLSNDELSDATIKVAIPEIKSMHETINETIINGTQSDGWVITQVEQFSNELHRDIRYLSTDSLRKQMAEFYTELQEIIRSTNKLNSLILNKKEENPMISDEAVSIITELNQNVTQLDAVYMNTLNLVYVHSDDLLAVNNAVLVYHTFASILEKKK